MLSTQLSKKKSCSQLQMWNSFVDPITSKNNKNKMTQQLQAECIFSSTITSKKKQPRTSIAWQKWQPQLVEQFQVERRRWWHETAVTGRKMQCHDKETAMSQNAAVSWQGERVCKTDRTWGKGFRVLLYEWYNIGFF